MFHTNFSFLKWQHLIEFVISIIYYIYKKIFLLSLLLVVIDYLFTYKYVFYKMYQSLLNTKDYVDFLN